MPVILHRPYRTELKNCSVPEGDLFAFIAGPIMGARDFQAEAGTELMNAIPSAKTLHIADPRWTNIAPGTGLDPNSQRAWEKHHYRTACRLGRRGVMLFYIAAELQDVPVPNRPGRPYGQGTRSEFSEVIGIMQASEQPVQLALGIDPRHDGRGLGEYRHTAAEFGIPIHEGLQPTCQAAAELLMRGAQP